MMNQKEAVFSATVTVLAELGVELKGDIKTLPNIKDIRERVTTLVVEGFRAKQVKLESTTITDADLTTYTKGLINNWYRKDVRLNGGAPYEAKNPGSRAHVGNPEARELKKLRAEQEANGASAETLAMIDAAIEAKVAEAKAAKAPKADLTKISPDLLKQLGLK